MSADNLLMIKKTPTGYQVEERRMSFPEVPGEVLYTNPDYEQAFDWAWEECDKRIVEYGVYSDPDIP